MDATDTIPEQTRKTISGLRYFLVENMRSARRYISSLKLGLTIEDLHFEVYDKRSTFDEIMELLLTFSQGENIGIISEAGCPGVADPGALAVAAAHQCGMKVVPLAGPSSILLALMASGFNGQSFSFKGYLPIDKHERQQRIRQLESRVTKTGESQIFMETPYRNESLFKTLIETCHGDTQLCIAAGISSQDESIHTRSIKTWKKKPPPLHKVPTIFILGR